MWNFFYYLKFRKVCALENFIATHRILTAAFVFNWDNEDNQLYHFLSILFWPDITSLSFSLISFSFILQEVLGSCEHIHC